MSHISIIKCSVTSLNSLKLACKRLGFEFKEFQTTHKWFSGHNPCLHAIKVPDANYEIGLVKNKENPNVYDFSYDDYDYGLMDKIGKNAWKLVQAYEVCHATQAAKMKGYIVKEEIKKDRIRLRVML